MNNLLYRLQYWMLAEYEKQMRQAFGRFFASSLSFTTSVSQESSSSVFKAWISRKLALDAMRAPRVFFGPTSNGVRPVLLPDTNVLQKTNHKTWNTKQKSMNIESKLLEKGRAS